MYYSCVLSWIFVSFAYHPLLFSRYNSVRILSMRFYSQLLYSYKMMAVLKIMYASAKARWTGNTIIRDETFEMYSNVYYTSWWIMNNNTVYELSQIRHIMNYAKQENKGNYMAISYEYHQISLGPLLVALNYRRRRDIFYSISCIM